MTKKKTAKTGGQNKSQAIKEQLKITPNATANEIADAASKASGLDVKPGLVYQIKSTNGSSPKKKARRKKTARRTQSRASVAVRGDINMQLIKEAAILLSHAGDPKAAQEALNAAAEISKALGK